METYCITSHEPVGEENRGKSIRKRNKEMVQNIKNKATKKKDKSKVNRG